MCCLFFVTNGFVGGCPIYVLVYFTLHYLNSGGCVSFNNPPNQAPIKYLPVDGKVGNCLIDGTLYGKTENIIINMNCGTVNIFFIFVFFNIDTGVMVNYCPNCKCNNG